MLDILKYLHSNTINILVCEPNQIFVHGSGVEMRHDDEDCLVDGDIR